MSDLSQFQERVLEILRGSADIYEERSAVYKDNFRAVGRVMEALFPYGHGQSDQLDHNRWHIFELIIVKLTRYANNYDAGGHEDSLRDMIAYLGILGALDDEFAQEKPSEPQQAELVVELTHLARPYQKPPAPPYTPPRVVKDSPQA